MQAEDFQEGVKNLDPLQTSLMELAFDWSKKLRRPIRIMHDGQNGFTDKVMKAVMTVATTKTPAAFNLPDRRCSLIGTKHIDSKADPRIQLAEIAAGFTRQVAEGALDGTAEEERLPQIQRLVHSNSIWGDSRSWEQIRPRDWCLTSPLPLQ
jgi:hypothetical protein